MADFLEFKTQFELEMGLDLISAVSTNDVKSTAKKSRSVKSVKNDAPIKEGEGKVD
jgi:hypothetical protein